MPPKNGRWWLTTDRRQATIQATAEDVYDLVADLARMGEWSPECQKVEWTGDSAGPTVGATFVGHNKGGPAGLMRWSRRGKILVTERGRSFAFITEEGGRESTEWRYDFQQVEGGTRVTESYDVRWIPTWARIVDVPTNRHKELSEGMEHTLARLKAAAESSIVSGPAA